MTEPLTPEEAREWAAQLDENITSLENGLNKPLDEIRRYQATALAYADMRELVDQSERLVREMTDTPKGEVPLSLLAQHAPLLAAENARLRSADQAERLKEIEAAVGDLLTLREAGVHSDRRGGEARATIIRLMDAAFDRLRALQEK